ncbi:MAG: aminodeoxychorismate/anthranilate synthase component II [Thermoflavifilum sp.]|nr:aminodeoxychorismate/anthranilate synthase component II [Thermoflavifilum sp.]
MRILVFDNYDSFTYNLVHLVRKLTTDRVDVFRNDELPLEKVAVYDKIILSPGPGIPKEAGLLLPLIREYASSKSILGVCLGHQAIGEAFGANLLNLSQVYHGVATPVYILRQDLPIFQGLPESIQAGRYHSWVVDENGLPDCLQITARDDQQYIMGLHHTQYDVTGVQFHPESVLTPHGERMMANWLKA